jgi:hypothetical protein
MLNQQPLQPLIKSDAKATNESKGAKSPSPENLPREKPAYQRSSSSSSVKSEKERKEEDKEEARSMMDAGGDDFLARKGEAQEL